MNVSGTPGMEFMERVMGIEHGRPAHFVGLSRPLLNIS
jgi:hypothetical protein